MSLKFKVGCITYGLRNYSELATTVEYLSMRISSSKIGSKSGLVDNLLFEIYYVRLGIYSTVLDSSTFLTKVGHVLPSTSYF